MADIEVTREAIDRLFREAELALPEEACGLLLGRAGRIEQVVAVRNVHPTPNTHFEIEPQALIDAHRAEREGGRCVVGYYHSHPQGAAEPSPTDCAQASGDGRVWAIAASGVIRFWRDDEAGFVELSTRLTSG